MRIEQTEDVTKLQMADTLRQAVADESGHASWDEMVQAYGAYKQPKDFAILISDSFQQVMGKIIAALISPWINVKERLPERVGDELYSEKVIILFDDGDIMAGCYFFEQKDWGGGYGPAYWMPKPALPKNFIAKT